MKIDTEKIKLHSGYEKLQKRDLATLLEMAKAVFGSFEIKTILNNLIHQIASIIEVNRCSVVLVNEEDRYGVVVATYENPDIDNLRIELSKYPEIEKVLQDKKILCIDDASTEPLMKGVREKLSQIGLFSFMILPLTFHEEFLGTLFLRTTRGKPSFSYREKMFCQIAATAATKALVNARLYSSVQDNFRNTVVSMAKSLEKRDEYTMGHSEKVSEYSLMIAQEFDFSESDINVIKYASLLHDIGKIGIRDSVLKKQGPLTREEFEEIIHHPQYGVEILSPIAGMVPMLPLVLHHHEFFDGKGYPDGLKGEAIPVGARIVGIADAFEAMSSNRPYRKAFPKKIAVQRLKENSGTQFDPDILRIFLKAI